MSTSKNSFGSTVPLPGTEVEFTHTDVATLVPYLDAYRDQGQRPPHFLAGREYLDTAPGDLATVVTTTGERVEVQIQSGPWTGRRGWVEGDWIRPKSSSSGQPEDARPPDDRRSNLVAALEALDGLTDAVDADDEVWAEAARDLDAQRPHRPLFGREDL